MNILDTLHNLGWAKNPKNTKYSRRLHDFLIENIICGLDCPGDNFFCCLNSCPKENIDDIELHKMSDDRANRFLGPKGCSLPRKDMPFYCLTHICNHAYERIANDIT